MDPYRRSRSQSRFPPIDEYPIGYPTAQGLDRSQRSKSLDNRREFVPEDDYDPYRSIERNSTIHASMPRRQPRNEAGGDGFFNESITIPTQQTGKASSKQFSGQREEMAGDDEWTSYDRQVRYHNERTAYPVPNPRRFPSQTYYDEYSTFRRPQYPPIQGPHSPGSRYPDSEYGQRSQRVQQQSLQQQHYPLDHSRSMEAQSAAQRETMDRGADYRYFEEESAHRSGAALADTNRSMTGGVAGGGGGGHRSYHYHHESHSGGGAAGGGAARHGYTNGYASQYREKRGGGFFGASRRGGSNEPRVYHRIHCCCFTFKWPPWSYEECEPPRPMYVKPKGSPMLSHQGPPPPPGPPAPQY